MITEEDKLERAALNSGEAYFEALRTWTSTYQQRTELRLKWEAACQAMVEFKTKLKKVDNGEAV